MQQTAKLTTITPDIARSILKQNTHNRQLRQHVVMRYADQMTAGDWKITGDTIKIASDGTVLDGQHRLLACIESGVTFQAYLVCGLDREVYDLIDAGLPRRTSDALHIQGEINTALLGSVLGWISRFELGTLAHRYSPKLTSHEALELLRRHPGIRQFVSAANGTHQIAKLGRGSIIAACFYLFHTQAPALAEQFFDKLATGAGLKTDEPVYYLRERLLKEKDKLAKMPAHFVLALYFRAWSHTRAGRKVRNLPWWRPDHEDFPDIGPVDFPEPAREEILRKP